MAKIHHNTLKKAAANGLEIIEKDGKFIVVRVGEKSVIARALDPKDALDLAIQSIKPKKSRRSRDEDEEFDEEDIDGEEQDEEAADEETDDEEGEGKSIVKGKYKQKYRPHKMTNGDDLAKAIREHFMTKRDPDTKKPRLDYKAFVAFAKRNDCWVESYATLPNHGMVRMNVVNRLRAKVRKDKEFQIQW